MKTSYRNIVFVGFSKEEQREIKIKDRRKLKEEEYLLAPHLKRFPYCLYLESMELAKKHQGFAIIIKYHGKLSKEEFSKKYYKSLSKKYYHVITCNNWKENIEIPNLEVIEEEKLYEDRFFRTVNAWYYDFLKSVEQKQKIEEKIRKNAKKGAIAIKLKTYLEDKESISSKDLAKHFNLPHRTAQRYITYMIDIFDNMEYSGKLKRWIKKR